TTPLEVTKDSTDLVFKIVTAAASPAGNHNSLFCRITVTENGEPVIHNIGTGKLRIDVPLPPKKNEPAPAAPPPMPEAKPAEAAPKRLTRLEQLRLEQAEREKAKKAPAAPPATPEAKPQ
ncbi:MAG: hypothetical protein ACKOJF_13925, partial [Planctomycetaceae bacterium]